MSINKCFISGNIGGEPEARQTSSGMFVLTFSVAVNERVKDSEGNWGDRPNWVSCTFFGTRAEKLQAYLVKGTKVAIEGKLRYSSWESKDGSRRSKLEVIVDEIEFMSRGNGQQQAGYAPAPKPAPQPVQAAVYDEDTPF